MITIENVKITPRTTMPALERNKNEVILRLLLAIKYIDHLCTQISQRLTDLERGMPASASTTEAEGIPAARSTSQANLTVTRHDLQALLFSQPAGSAAAAADSPLVRSPELLLFNPGFLDIPKDQLSALLAQLSTTSGKTLLLYRQTVIESGALKAKMVEEAQQSLNESCFTFWKKYCPCLSDEEVEDYNSKASLIQRVNEKYQEACERLASLAGEHRSLGELLKLFVLSDYTSDMVIQLNADFAALAQNQGIDMRAMVASAAARATDADVPARVQRMKRTPPNLTGLARDDSDEVASPQSGKPLLARRESSGVTLDGVLPGTPHTPTLR